MPRSTDKKLFSFLMFTPTSTHMWIYNEQEAEGMRVWCEEHGFKYNIKECSNPWLTKSDL